jgi:hypothetical protein
VRGDEDDGRQLVKGEVLSGTEERGLVVREEVETVDQKESSTAGFRIGEF